MGLVFSLQVALGVVVEVRSEDGGVKAIAGAGQENKANELGKSQGGGEGGGGQEK